MSYIFLACLVFPGCGGGTSGASIPVSSNAPVKPVVPAAPDGVLAIGAANRVTLSWNQVSGAATYSVYWSTNSGITTATGSRVDNASSPFIQTGLDAGRTYYYLVTASNSGGESSPCAPVWAATIAVPTAVPAPPIGVSAVGGTNRITLSWPGVNAASSYNVYWSTNSGVTTANGNRIANVVPPFVHKLLPANSSYYYVITSTNAVGEGSASTQASSTTAAIDGMALYDANCSPCHGGVVGSQVRLSSATLIKGTIANGGAMQSLSTLTDAELQAIADVLN